MLFRSVTVENAVVNGLSVRLCDKDVNGIPVFTGAADGIEVADGNVLEDEALRAALGSASYDIVVANILADVIIPLSGIVKEFMKPDALFISSGIINTKREAVEAALLENGFEILEVNMQGDWVSITAKVSAQA